MLLIIQDLEVEPDHSWILERQINRRCVLHHHRNFISLLLLEFPTYKDFVITLWMGLGKSSYDGHIFFMQNIN